MRKFLFDYKAPLLVFALILALAAASRFSNKTYLDPFFFGSQNLEPAQPSPSPSSAVQSLLENQVSNLPGSYGVYIKDLKNGNVYSVDPDEQFTAASIYKLAVMYEVFNLINTNQMSLSDTTSTGATVEDALNLMITVSDNDSALALAETVGWDNIQNYLDSTGVSGFNLLQDTPTVNTKAVATLLERIYRGQAVSKDASQKMMSLLLGQQVNDKIPALLPEDVKVAHKTGELDSARNDAGIVFGKKSDYIFVFLSDTPAPQDAVENIANLSKTMFEALENNTS